MLSAIISSFLISASAVDAARAIIQPHSAVAGLSVRSLKGNELVQVNGLKGMTPASVAKMVSSACSLESLGPDYKFETAFGVSSEIKDGVLNGNLIVRGSGDPSFVIEDLKQIIEILRVVYELKEIRGKLIFDVSYFGKESLQIGEGFEGDDGRSFATELTAIPFDHNSFAIWVAPGSPKPLVHVIPDFAIDLKINNNARTTEGSTQAISVDYRKSDKSAIVSGSIGREAQPKAVYRGIDSPFDSLARVFVRIWKEMGGVWNSPAFEISKSSVQMKRLYTHESRAVSRILMDINKLSTNFGAELVSLAAAEKAFGRPVTSEGLAKFLSACIKNFGISAEGITLTNASGLSRKTQIAPSALTDLLVKLQAKEYFPEYLSSLSIMGRDGTTRSRLKNYAGRARLKTGSIKGVRSIAGYLYPLKSEPLAFSLIFNGTKLSDAQTQELENQVIDKLLEM